MARPAVDRELLAALDDKLGPSNTDKLLALVPPDVSQLVTKNDLAVFGAELRAEMADLRGELRTDMANLRADIVETLHQEMRKQTLFLVGAMLGLAGAFIGTQAFV